MKKIIILMIFLVFLISCKQIQQPTLEVKEEQTNWATEPIKEAEVKVEEQKQEEIKEEKLETETTEEKNEALTEEEQKVYDAVTEACIYQETETGKQITALKNNDENSCKQIEDKDMQELCIAEVQKNPAICQNAAEPKLCEAILSKKSELCEKEDHYCLGLTTKDTAHCTEIEDPEAAIDCFLYTELKTEDFTEKRIGERCRDGTYLFMATEQYPDKKFCEYIKDAEARNDCRATFEGE